ncbi:MAG: restriction endonuclease subunit S [Clostridiales bacterium]|jgi:restriction endonuclease S subunit|nr:restriction endonuclease subunit S [Clostridiales bacterium]
MTIKTKLFKIMELFIIHKGTRLTKDEMVDGSTNYLGAIDNNNGVRQQIDALPKFQGNYITVNYNGSVGEAFYQNQPFWASDDVNVLELKNHVLNEKIALYIITVIRANRNKFSYGRKWTMEKMREEEILLPIDKNNSPDWNYMEKYISDLNIVLPKTNNVSKNAPSLDLTKWKSFLVGDLFKVVRGKRIVKDVDFFNELSGEYCIPVITPTTKNNSIDGFYHDYNCAGNSVVCGGEAAGMFATYQKDNCWVMDRSRIFQPKNNTIINKYTSMFLLTLFNFNHYLFSYGRSANPNIIENIIIKLPVTDNDTPDWQYMENYIKSLPYADII